MQFSVFIDNVMAERRRVKKNGFPALSAYQRWKNYLTSTYAEKVWEIRSATLWTTFLLFVSLISLIWSKSHKILEDTKSYEYHAGR